MVIDYFLSKQAFIPNIFGTICISQKDDYNILDDQLPSIIIDDIKNCSFENQTINDIKFFDYSNSSEKFITFNDIGTFEKNIVTYHFFNIICKKYTEAVFCIRCSKRHKIWINNNLFTITTPTEQIFLIKLDKGKNTVILETANTRPGDNFFLRVSTYEYEKQCKEKGLLANSLRDFNDIKTVCCNRTYLKNKNNLEFIIFSNNTITFDNDQLVNIELFDVDSEEIFVCKKVKFGERVIIKTDKLSYQKIEILNHLRLKITYKGIDEALKVIRIPIFLYDVNDGVNYYYQKAKDLLKKDSITTYDYLSIKYKLKQINLENPISGIDNILSLAGNIKSIESGNHMDSTIYLPGSKRVFYKSALDNSIIAYHAYTPKNYDSNKQYPLIVHFSTYSLTNYSQYYKNYLKEDVVAVDISQRGFTMGSYIGEAAILETLEDVFKKFSINRRRVYLIGHSNGAYAVWSMAQAYPHMFAGALIISGGVNNHLIANMKNMKIINISSSNERGYDSSFRKIQYYLKQNELAESINIPQHCHNTLMFHLSDSNYISKMLDNESDDYPKHVEYCTLFNRHRKAYWVEIHSIKEWGKYAKIKVDVRENNIYIKTSNITGATLYIPPYINKSSFYLIINKNAPIYVSTTNENVSFFIKNKKVVIKESDMVPQLYRGTGLLDVYLGPVTVVSTLKKSDNIARRFSTPVSNGSNPRLQITYPVVKIKHLDQESNKRNLIIVDFNSSNSFVKRVRKKLPITMEQNGYRLKEKTYVGNYCVMVVTSNPLNEKATILYINANDEKFVEKNFFVRNMILPSYSNGFHPFLNNEILVFDSEGYRVYNF